VPVVPVHLSGLFEIYSIHHDWPEPGKVKVTVGAPLRFNQEQDEQSATRAIEQAIAAMAASHFTS